MTTQKPEALIFANDRPTYKSEDLYQWAIDAEDLIRSQHARIAELEAELAAVKAAPAPQAQDVQDAGLLDWLSKQYIGPDFRLGDPETEVVVIEMPKGCSYCGDFKMDMRAAIAASAKGGEAA